MKDGGTIMRKASLKLEGCEQGVYVAFSLSEEMKPKAYPLSLCTIRTVSSKRDEKTFPLGLYTYTL